MKAINTLLLAAITWACLASNAYAGWFGGDEFKHIKNYKADQSLSFANNVVHAIGMKGIKDLKVSSEDIAKIRGGKGGVSQLAHLGGGIALALDDGFGMGNTGAIGLEFLYQLSRDNTVREKYPAYIVFQKAGDERSYADEAYKYLSENIRSYLSEPLDVSSFAEDELSVNWSVVRFSGGSCNQSADAFKFNCGIRVAERYGKAKLKSDSILEGRLKDVDLPDFVGGKGNIERGGFSQILHEKDNPSNVYVKFNSLELYTNMTKSLGEAFFLYLAPNTYFQPNAEGELVLGKAPIVINNGVIHPFVIEA